MNVRGKTQMSLNEEKQSAVLSWPEWFDRAAKVFDDPRMKIAYYKNGRTGEPYSEEAVRRTHEDIFCKLAPKPAHAVLDVGCGVGYFEKFFSGRVGTLIGADVSVRMIESAKKLNPGGTFVVAFGDRLPFGNTTFDRIFSYGVTQYLPDEKTALAMLDEMRRLLKPGGRIMLGDILEPVEKTPNISYSKPTPKGKPWWPKELDHDLKKLYLAKDFFGGYAGANGLTAEFFDQNIPGRPLPTPRYDVVLNS